MVRKACMPAQYSRRQLLSYLFYTHEEVFAALAMGLWHFRKGCMTVLLRSAFGKNL